MAMIELRLVQPKCDECTACCHVLSTRELRKPYNVDCEHLCKTGCSIYEQRPESCRTYQCVWLTHGVPMMTDADRPDKSGFLINMEEDDLGIWIEVFYTREPTKEVKLRAIAITDWMMKRSRLPLRTRFYEYNVIVPTKYKLDTKKYPDEGEGGGKRDFGSSDGIFFQFVHKKVRKEANGSST